MSYLKNIKIENFKSIKDLKLDNCNRINLLVGQPNVGKSNVLEAMAVPGLYTNDSIKYLNEVLRYSGFYDLLNQGNFENKIKIMFQDFDFIYSFILEKDDAPIHFSFGHDVFDVNNPKVSILNNDRIINKKSFPQFYKFNNNIDYKNGFETELSTPYGNNLATTINQFPELFSKIQNYFKQTNEEFIISIDENGIRKPKISFNLENGVKQERNFNLIADTLKRIIFHLTAIASNKNATLLFEEPEAHCYEPYLLDFTNAIKFDKNNNQYFIVTHSDYIIQEFLRESEYREQTNIYMVNNVGNGTEVLKLNPLTNQDIFEFGTNIFFNFDQIWKENNA